MVYLPEHMFYLILVSNYIFYICAYSYAYLKIPILHLLLRYDLVKGVEVVVIFLPNSFRKWRSDRDLFFNFFPFL